MAHEDEGSYRYRGHWEQIDQMLVSVGMLETRRLRLDDEPFSCFSISPMFRKNSKYPWRTYEKRGNTVGGFSDHLPCYSKCVPTPETMVSGRRTTAVNNCYVVIYPKDMRTLLYWIIKFLSVPQNNQ